MKSIKHSSFANSKLFGKIIKVFFGSAKRNLNAVLSIFCLITNGYPLAVIGFIIAIIFHPFNAESGLIGRPNHVGIEIGKYQPSGTDFDSATAISRKFFVFGVGTTGHHRSPNSDDGMSFASRKAEKSTLNELPSYRILHGIIPIRDDGRYANSQLRQWFDKLASGKGLCCSISDGYSVEDVDWESKGDSFRVRIPKAKDSSEMIWMDVPPDALITEPNLAGKTMVWPIYGYDGPSIRCFMPGSMT